jgi:hypothetical protein
MPPRRSPRSPFSLAALGAAAVLAAGLAASPASAKKPTVILGPNSLGPCPGAPVDPEPACPDDAIDPDLVIQGQFPLELMGSYVMLPFEVPPGTTSVRVRYCFEGDGHVVDLGLWEARVKKKPWAVEQFRGWGGSSHPDVTITPQGFGAEEEYEASPKCHVAGRTTRGFLPGPIPAGTWAAELGVGAVVPADEGDEDGLADWRVEIELSEDLAFDDDPYLPEPYDATPANPNPGWYAGDMHVHAEHSALGDATMTETFDFAFRSLDDPLGGAGLDFITLSDYVTPSGWGEIGRYQKDHPGKLIIRSSEVITYRGHTNNHASARYVDHRMGPVYELLLPDARLKKLRGAQDPKAIFKQVQAAGGWTQLNHVTTCPSRTPTGEPDPFCLRTCRGCPWDYARKETKPSRVDAVEIASGPPQLFAPTNVFTVAAIAFWEELLDRGARIAAVGSSDSHHAGMPETALQSPIGKATTVVFAEQLSEQGIAEGVRSGHTYVKIFGNEVPDLRLEATEAGSGDPPAIFGDTIKGKSISFAAQVLGAAEPGLELLFVKDGVETGRAPVPLGTSDYAFLASGPGRYRLELRRGEQILVLTSPIYVKRKQ